MRPHGSKEFYEAYPRLPNLSILEFADRLENIEGVFPDRKFDSKCHVDSYYLGRCSPNPPNLLSLPTEGVDIISCGERANALGWLPFFSDSWTLSLRLTNPRSGTYELFPFLKDKEDWDYYSAIRRYWGIPSDGMVLNIFCPTYHSFPIEERWAPITNIKVANHIRRMVKETGLNECIW